MSRFSDLQVQSLLILIPLLDKPNALDDGKAGVMAVPVDMLQQHQGRLVEDRNVAERGGRRSQPSPEP
ncbi:hypothetical protein P7K49_004513 [Saguinus oedipus]|uniref:Uncharacterized protein n=1 Tax=Saguinus oedipus TaxID=9490 RepID=A0ABQ9W7M6_SAGOE|nr:hypothetical protein P7K49_004513 [Saguinus oedipus]